MSDIIVGIRAYLLEQASVTALVEQRIYPDELPQKDGRVEVESPAITLELAGGGGSESDLSGGSGIASSRVSVTCYGATRRAANQLAEAVRVLLLKLRGVAGEEQVRSVQAASGPHDLTDVPSQGDAQFRYLRIRDYEITHAEATAPHAP